MLRYRDLGASLSRFGCFVFESWVLHLLDLDASLSKFGCFVLRSSFSTLPTGICRGILKTRGTRRKKEKLRNRKPTKFTMVKKETVIVL